jgi:hypothetical protein
MFRRMTVAVAAMVVCLGVSAKQPEAPMPVAADLPVELIQNQNELAVDVSSTAGAIGMQFGLIGALIGSGIQNAQAKKAEERVVPLRDLLIHYDFNARLEQALRAKLASEGLSPNPRITVLKTPWDAVDAHNAQDVPLQALVLSPRYSIDSGFTQLTVQVNAQLVQRTIKPNGRIKTAAQFNRTYAYHFPMQARDDAEPAQRWARMGGPALERMLDEGIAQTTDMLVYDFSAQGRAEWTQPTDGSVTVAGITYQGRPLRQEQDHAWVRIGKKWGQSLQGYHPVDGSVPAVVAATPAAPAPVAAATGAVDASAAATPVAPVAGAPATPAADAAPASVPASVPAATAGSVPAAGH